MKNRQRLLTSSPNLDSSWNDPEVPAPACFLMFNGCHPFYRPLDLQRKSMEESSWSGVGHRKRREANSHPLDYRTLLRFLFFKEFSLGAAKWSFVRAARGWKRQHNSSPPGICLKSGAEFFDSSTDSLSYCRLFHRCPPLVFKWPGQQEKDRHKETLLSPLHFSTPCLHTSSVESEPSLRSQLDEECGEVEKWTSGEKSARRREVGVKEKKRPKGSGIKFLFLTWGLEVTSGLIFTFKVHHKAAFPSSSGAASGPMMKVIDVQKPQTKWWKGQWVGCFFTFRAQLLGCFIEETQTAKDWNVNEEPTRPTTSSLCLRSPPRMVHL